MMYCTVLSVVGYARNSVLFILGTARQMGLGAQNSFLNANVSNKVKNINRLAKYCTMAKGFTMYTIHILCITPLADIAAFVDCKTQTMVE